MTFNAIRQGVSEMVTLIAWALLGQIVIGIIRASKKRILSVLNGL